MPFSTLCLTIFGVYVLVIGVVQVAAFVDGNVSQAFKVAARAQKMTATLKTQLTRPPNIIFILTDDQDLILGGMKPMVKTRSMIERNGVKFENMFVTTPLCCPSRASILTGLYSHNHHVVNNSVSGNCSSSDWQRGPELSTIATWLKKANYTTFYAGKYLNQYGFDKTGGVRHIPPGWDQWIGLVGNSRYYNYTLSVNGSAEHHGSHPYKDYFTSVIENRAVEFISKTKGIGPFFMMLAPPAPHAPFTPLPKYAGNFSHTQAPRTPNFNIPTKQDKHWIVRQAPTPLPVSVIEQIDDIYRHRWQTLLSVDDMVEKIVLQLEKLGLLSSTYIFFSSDNGYHMGQFSLPEDKRQLYEFDIRVPLLVRGPGIPSKGVIKEPVLNIDLAPTFLDLAAIEPPSSMDGRSFAPLLLKTALPSHKWRTAFVVEHHGEGGPGPIKGCPQYIQGGVYDCVIDCICEDAWNNTYTCLRTVALDEDSIYCQFHDDEEFVEAYNIISDPFQLKNLHLLADTSWLKRKTSSLASGTQCLGRECWPGQ